MEKLQSRLERAEKFDRRERRDRTVRAAKLSALAVGAIIVLSGAVWGFTALADVLRGPECEQIGFHEHTTFYVFDEGERLRFVGERFDLDPMPMRAHLHQPNDYMLHLEGDCATMREAFAFMGMDLQKGRLRLDQETHGGKVLEDNATHTLRFFLYSPEGEAWSEFPELPGHQGRQGERILITYGDLTDEEIAGQQAQVPPPSE